MRYITRDGGHPVLENTPALACAGGILDCVNLSAWINFTRSSGRLRAVEHSESRPTALFKQLSGREAEVVYALGYVISVKGGEISELPMIEELATYLNELLKA